MTTEPIPQFTPGSEDKNGVEELGLKNKTEQQLLDNLFEMGKSWTAEQAAMVEAAYELAKELHKDNRHRTYNYVYHLLRNANRVMGYLHLDDPELIAAVLLHDAVEDHPDEIIETILRSEDGVGYMIAPEDPKDKQAVALDCISVFFSPEVSTTVAAVSNPPHVEGKGLSYEEGLEQYRATVEKAVETINGWVAKFVDWQDNAVGIIHSDEAADSEIMKHRRRKYRMVQPILMNRFRQPDIQKLLDPAAKAYVERQFKLGVKRLGEPIEPTSSGVRPVASEKARLTTVDDLIRDEGEGAIDSDFAPLEPGDGQGPSGETGRKKSIDPSE